VFRFEDENEGRSFDHVVSPLAGSDVEISKVVAIGRDITDRNRAEDTLRESVERSPRQHQWLPVWREDGRGDKTERHPETESSFRAHKTGRNPEPRQELYAGIQQDSAQSATLGSGSSRSGPCASLPMPGGWKHV
jgi:hypothetical protein